MSISPPSDIVLDVARAADPTRLQEAAARLKRLTPVSGPAFSDVLDAAPTEASAKPAASPPLPRTATLETASLSTRPPTVKPVPSPQAKAYESFEAMTLSTFIEAAMPDDASAVFGSGTAGNVWKSMLAQQIAEQMARAGGIGIADQLAAAAAKSATHPQKAGPGSVAANGAPSLPPMHLTTAMERGFLRTLMPDLPSTDDTSNS